jgi:ATP-binding cassette subfamily F protein uup
VAGVNVVNLDAVSKAFGTSVVLEAVSLGVAEGDRIGVVGRNGGGKSTLLALLTGDLVPDDGRVTHAGALTVGRLGQGDSLDPEATVMACVVGTTAAEHEWAGDARVRGVLDGLLSDISRNAIVGSLSGGERRRVGLASLLVADPDLLCLDEPTNHLDVEGVAWLAGHLRSRRGAVVVVTHDRWFLDATTAATWEVAAGDVHQYDGGYAAYVLARAERARQAAATEGRRQNLLRKELAWLRRGPPARTSKPRFRIDAANALIADVPAPRDSVSLQRIAGARLGKDVVDVEDVSLSLGDRSLLAGVTWRLGPGDRVGLLGRNGAGKSTLLRLISGERRPDSGRVRVGRTVVAAELSQELDQSMGLAGLRLLQAVEEVASWIELAGGQRLSASQLLERLGFPAARQWTPVADLSGGERRRLQLMRLLMTGPNLLLLDEPTNDLDIDTLTEVEDLLDSYAGTLVVVSHDRWFLERTCDQVWALPGDGSLRHLPGGVEDYLALRRAPAVTTGPSDEREGRADPRRARRELAKIERRLDRLAADRDALLAQLAEHATDHEVVLGLDTRLRALDTERESLESDWLTLADD